MLWRCPRLMQIYRQWARGSTENVRQCLPETIIKDYQNARGLYSNVWMETQLAEHKIEPNSGLGKAIEFGSKARRSSLHKLAENSRCYPRVAQFSRARRQQLRTHHRQDICCLRVLLPPGIENEKPGIIPEAAPLRSHALTFDLS